ncbi:hypothetical protein AB4076_11045 [Dyella sp. 2RAF44]|uniref:hypothetical protein n=1 Tax=Dyella sp. 2RAF44 TaxID=3233000 RepID=UPI003F935C2C
MTLNELFDLIYTTHQDVIAVPMRVRTGNTDHTAELNQILFKFPGFNRLATKDSEGKWSVG